VLFNSHHQRTQLLTLLQVEPSNKHTAWFRDSPCISSHYAVSG